MSEKNETSESLKGELRELMDREISILRELLSSMREEQQILVENRAEQLKHHMEKREPILKAMAEHREKRLELIKELYISLGHEIKEGEEIDDKESLSILTEYASAESCGILVLRDQMLALLDELTSQTNRNNFLIENKLSTTKEFLTQLHPSDPNMTYGDKGTLKKKGTKTKVRIINQEV